MAGDGVLYEWDDSDMQALIAKSIRNVEDMTPVMRSYAEYLVKETDERFKKEVSPDGTPWMPLSPLTVANKARQNKIDKILQQDGYLRLVHPSADRRAPGFIPTGCMGRSITGAARLAGAAK